MYYRSLSSKIIQQLKNMKNYIIASLKFAFVILLLAGCAVIEQPGAYETEDQLAKCGFKQRLADTQAKLDKLKALPQRKLILRVQDGTNYYVYANAHQKCLFVGNEKAYQRYQKSELQKQIENNNLTADAENKAAANDVRVETFDWEMGDMWVPWMWY